MSIKVKKRNFLKKKKIKEIKAELGDYGDLLQNKKNVEILEAVLCVYDLIVHGDCPAEAPEPEAEPDEPGCEGNSGSSQGMTLN